MSQEIYRPTIASGFEWVNAVRGEDYEVFLSLDGTPRAARWTPVAVRRVRKDAREEVLPSDFPWLGGHALILRRSAVVALRDLLDANGEVLPLSTADGVELSVFNARVIDALDEAHSSLIKFPGTNRVMRIKKPAFVPTAIVGVDLFRLPHRSTPTYVSRKFVERVKAAGLKGLQFDEVWAPSPAIEPG